MKIYVSIPVSADDYIDQRNHAFVVATNLAQKGYDAITPFDIVPSLSFPHNQVVGKCIAELLECDAIYMCMGWQESKQCCSEFQVALAYRKRVLTE